MTLGKVETITAFAEEMSEFLKTSELTETRVFVHSFVKQVAVRPGKATIIYAMPTPEDSPMGGCGRRRSRPKRTSYEFRLTWWARAYRTANFPVEDLVVRPRPLTGIQSARGQLLSDTPSPQHRPGNCGHDDHYANRYPQPCACSVVLRLNRRRDGRCWYGHGRRRHRGRCRCGRRRHRGGCRCGRRHRGGWRCWETKVWFASWVEGLRGCRGIPPDRPGDRSPPTHPVI